MLELLGYVSVFSCKKVCFECASMSRGERMCLSVCWGVNVLGCERVCLSVLAVHWGCACIRLNVLGCEHVRVSVLACARV